MSKAPQRGPGRPVGSTKPDAKVAIKLRVRPATLAAWRASGPGWMGRIDALLTEHAPNPD